MLSSIDSAPIKADKVNPSIHGDMGLGWSSWGVTPRSLQGHIKVTARSNKLKSGENYLFV